MAETDTKTVIKISTEIEGDRDGTANYRFNRIGEPVPVTSDKKFSFDLESLPGRPFALSERFGAVFVAHLNVIIEAVTVPNEMLGFAALERFGVIFVAHLNCLFVAIIEAVALPIELLGFARLGEPVPVTSDQKFIFDLESLPSRPFALSVRFGAVFVVHLNGENTNYVISNLIRLNLGLFVAIVVDAVREPIELVIVEYIYDTVIVPNEILGFVVSEWFGVVFVAYLNGQNTNYVVRKLIRSVIYCCVDSVIVSIELAVTVPNEMLGFAVWERFGFVFVAPLNQVYTDCLKRAD
ncbi:hypothetical protein Tco_1013828 [Tanacetum coccineum]